MCVEREPFPYFPTDPHKQVQFLAWLDDKLNAGYDITEWEARTTLNRVPQEAGAFHGPCVPEHFRKRTERCPSPLLARKSEARMIDKNTRISSEFRVFLAGGHVCLTYRLATREDSI